MSFPWSFFGVYSSPLDDDIRKRRDWCFNTRWLRTKTTTTSVNVILPHRSKWLLCSVHAIACHAATLTSPSDYVYSDFRASGKNGISTMNSLFKRIQVLYENDMDNAKPNQYTRGLTSHSMRAGAEQLMHESCLLRREWSDRRVGRVRRSDSRDSYISSESWHDDYACALILSGWPSIHWGGKCPTKNCLPETEHQTFDAFIGEIFLRVPMVPVPILEIWGCILLLWHFEVKELKLDSDIVVKIETYLPMETLQQWHACVREAYKNLNESTLPIEVVQQLSVAENLTWQNTTIAKLQEDLHVVMQAQANQNLFNTAVVQRLDIIQENSTSTTTMVQRVIDWTESQQQTQQAPKRRRLNNEAPAPTLTQAQLPFQEEVQQPQEEVVVDAIDNLEAPQVQIPQAAAHIRRKKLSERVPNIETVFYNWYIEELWNYKGCDKNERSFLKNTVSTLVLYMKRFVPDNCQTLLEKPPEADVERRRAWVNDLRTLSLTAKERTMAFIFDYYRNVKLEKLGSCVVDKAKTYATRKYLREIPVQRYPPQLVVDRISQSTPYVFNNVDLEHFHNSA